MSQLNDAIKKIKTGYFTLEEFPLLDRNRFPLDSLKKIVSVSEKDLTNFVLCLKSADLNGMLLDLLEPQSEETLQCAARVLCIRKSKRLNQLLAFLIQYHYDKKGLLYVLNSMLNECGEVLKQNLFLATFADVKNPVDVLCDLLMQEGGTIEQTYQKYKISSNSLLAKDGCLAYFSVCGKNGFLMNEEQLLETLKLFELKRLVPMLTNYLKTLSLAEFGDTVNLMIGEQYGRPYESADWNFFPSDLRDKYAQWSYLYRLKIHCANHPKKYDVLMKYFEYIRSSSFLPETDILLMDFGWNVIVDPRDVDDSFLYERDYFEREVDQWRKNEGFIPIFLKRSPQILTAREFMLSTGDASCIRLNYEDIQHYYAQEVLDIKIGLEPDLREQKMKRSM
jgi:hypothetical protein